VIVNNRVGKGRSGMAGMSKTSDAAGDYGTPEQEIPATGFPGAYWESCMTMNGSWGFHQNDHNWKSARTLIRMLIETASKGGNFLLNVGPRADGTFPPEIVERLEAIGSWMDVNSEAIYGTQASPFKKLAWGRATSRPGRVYLCVEEWPKDGKLVVPGLKNDVRGAWVLSDKSMPSLVYTREGDDVVVSVPAVMPNEDATVIALDIAGEPEVAAAKIKAGADGVMLLKASDADVIGSSARYESGGGKDNIGYWTDANDSVTWDVTFARDGKYAVAIEYACEPGSEGSEFKVSLGGMALGNKVRSTGSWTAFKTVNLGTISFSGTGDATVTVTAQSKPGLAVMNLKSVRLTPVD
jgi:alpha-L-fucosidase